ncbi:hypothetical protein PG985_008145 [Apiospora marii]|uniref:uncharacterized protein n=1 Tax=Apiospora marii TaxID=335849 RepID=UPI003130BD76
MSRGILVHPARLQLQLARSSPHVTGAKAPRMSPRREDGGGLVNFSISAHVASTKRKPLQHCYSSEERLMKLMDDTHKFMGIVASTKGPMYIRGLGAKEIFEWARYDDHEEFIENNICPSQGSEERPEFLNRLRLRCHLFTASVGAINRWSPRAAYSRDRAAFFHRFVTHLQDHLDIAPLLIVALQDACMTTPPPSDAKKLQRLLRLAEEKAFDNWAELELRMAGLALYVPHHTSPDPFFKLMTEIHGDPCHQLRVGLPHENPQMRLARMHRLAMRCAVWLRRRKRRGDATKVLAMAKTVYNDQFLSYQRAVNNAGESSL